MRLALLFVLSACATPALSAPSTPAQREPEDTTAALALLPMAGGGARCVVALPTRLDPAERAAIAPVSQADARPYRLGALAFVRLEAGPSRTELMRFATPPSLVALRAELGDAVSWGAAPAPCFGELTCRAAHAEWLDPRTLRIQRGPEAKLGGDACRALLHANPRALEVAAREPSPSSALRESQVVLTAYREGIERTNTRRYASREDAQRAHAAALRGNEELPTLAGVSAEGLGELVDDRIVQRAYASYADLRLAQSERVRSEQPLPERIDPTDRAAVYAAFDARAAQLDTLDTLLRAALAVAADDEGLLQRKFQLHLLRDQASEAYALAHAHEGPSWALRARAALARFDPAALTRALREAHALDAASATRMAQELATAALDAKRDIAPQQERAEWTFLTSKRIGAARGARVPLTAKVLIAELPRLLTTLAESAQPERKVATQVLAFVAPAQEPAHGEAWWARSQGAGRPAVLISATSADDAQLSALGIALARTLDDGPFELRIALAREDGPRIVLSLQGRREGQWLLVEQGSPALRALHWDVLERLLAAPLRKITGSAFPPDELAFEARDDAELGQLEARAAQALRCERELRALRCRGALADKGAARRVLLAIAHDLLAREARALWSGAD